MGHKELLNETFSLCVMTSPELRWHPRWRSRDVCILLKYFHSLKYFSGVENISPWQSWYKSLCYLCPTVRDIGCWYICCFSFQSPHWFVCLLRIIETKYLWKTVEKELSDLTTNAIDLEKKSKWCQLGLIICYTLFTTRQSQRFPEL